MDSPPTKDYFLLEWVTSIYYGGVWYEIEEGTLREVTTPMGAMLVYIDKFSTEVTFVKTDIVTGWTIKQTTFRPVVVDPQE